MLLLEVCPVEPVIRVPDKTLLGERRQFWRANPLVVSLGGAGRYLAGDWAAPSSLPPYQTTF